MAGAALRVHCKRIAGALQARGYRTGNGLQAYGKREGATTDMCHIRRINLAHTITYYSCESRALRGRVRLYVPHSKIKTTHLIDGLSRAASPTLIDCV